MKPSTTLTLLLTTALASTVHAAGCTYVLQAGHCCNGSVYRSNESGDPGDPNNWICCQGDSLGVTNSQGSCPSGTPISLADAPSVGDSGTSSAGPAPISTTMSATGSPTSSATVEASTGGAASMKLGAVPVVVGGLFAAGVGVLV